jgi:nucleotide-binding universal stress UspA family protein
MVNRSSSRSKALIDMAADQKCDTLVLGRRGHSAVVEFFMGRVGRKAVEMSRNMAVWII